jgi:hypothetical protein
LDTLVGINLMQAKAPRQKEVLALFLAKKIKGSMKQPILPG